MIQGSALSPLVKGTQEANIKKVQLRRLMARGSLIALAAILAGQMRHRLTEIRAQLPAEESLLYLPPVNRLDAMSLGYKEALADLVWLRAIVFAGNGENGDKLDWLARYVRTINHLDPQFRRPYLWGAVVSIYSGKSMHRDMIDQSVAILREGLSHFPEDHELLFTLGMILYRDYESLGTVDAQAIAQYKQQGARLIRKAAAFGASPLVRQLAASLEIEGSDDALQAEFLRRQLIQAQDEGLRRLLKQKLKALQRDVDLGAIERAREDFVLAHSQEFPYLPPDLFALLQHSAND